MSRIVVTVVLLLISGLANNAAAQDGLKDTSQKDDMQKLHTYLEATGINNPKIVQFTNEMRNRREGHYLRLAEQKFESGRIVLHYAMDPRINIRQLALKFQPSYSKNTEFVATTKSVMYTYKWQF